MNRDMLRYCQYACANQADDLFAKRGCIRRRFTHKVDEVL
jgi:hypothetical protein